MSIFNFFRQPPRKSAIQAKERLQIVMAHERAGRSGPDYLPMLQQELLAVIAKYVDIDQNKVEVKLDRGGDFSTLEVNIELPSREQAQGTEKAAEKSAGQSGDSEPVKFATGVKALTNGGIKKRG
jgi:cell division topological specificity factor